MNKALIRGWLLKQPRAHSLRLTRGDDISQMAIGSESWAALAASCEAMVPDLIEALDENGKLIRATRGTEDDPLEPEGPAVRAAVGPVAMVDVATLQLMAKLLADAYKHSNEVAFGRLADLFTVSTKRSEALERSLERSERMRAKQAEDFAENLPEGQGGLLSEMLGQFMGGKATGEGSPPAPATNGKGH